MNFERSAGITKHEKERNWEAPSLRELKETENTFQQYQTEIANFFRLALLDKIKYKTAELGFFSDAKTFFQSPLIADENLFEQVSSVDEFFELRTFRDRTMSANEKKRHDAAFEKFSSIDATTEPRYKGEYAAAPKMRVPGAGTFLTNIYRSPNKQAMTLEDKRYRVNLALTHDISQFRVWTDLYESLCKNPELSKYGFDIKSLGNNRTDAIIIYCGENALPAAITETGNYCLAEDIGHVSGVPFGVAPLAKDGKFEGLRVTSTPGDGFTFNDLQTTALLEACEAVTRTFLKQTGSPKTFEEASTKDLEDLHAIIASKDPVLIRDLNRRYNIALRKICGTRAVDLHNLAFPTIKKAEDLEW